MPPEWLHIIQSNKYLDKGEVLWNLKHKYTVSDVYDILEILNIDNMYADEDYKKSQQESKNRR